MIRESLKKSGLLILFTFLTTACLLQSEKAFAFASNGLNLWFERMLPTLLPFMILTGILIRMDLSDSFAGLFAPLLRPVFRLSDSCIYILIIGFLCGFPMGSRVTAESLRHEKISRREAELMLAFCNNIGPIYLTGYVLALFPVDHPGWWIGGMYLVPVLYGLVLRYTVFRDIPFCTGPSFKNMQKEPPAESLLQATQGSILSALLSQASLGGYMIFFNLLNLIPDLLLPASDTALRSFCACLLEITGGLTALTEGQIVWAFAFLQFGGLSCIAQTYSMIQDTGLNLSAYVNHKLIQMVLGFVLFSVL